MRIRFVVKVLFVLALASSVSTAQARVLGSKHDLSVSGGALSPPDRGAQMCAFCHTPHILSPAVPAWNRSQGGPLYTPYWSPTLQASVGQPTGTSKLCLSCHDGTIASSSVPNPSDPGGLRFGAYGLSQRANLTSDLSDDHPVSFTYDAGLAAQDPELVSPSALPGAAWLDENDQVQCTSCHDPHSTIYSDFLVADNAYSRLCTMCHDKKGWTGSAHANSSAGWDGSGTDPWPYTEQDSVAASGCANCHTPHAAGIPESLLVFPLEEENCLSCHNGSAARSDIAAEMRKPFRHAIDEFSGVHVAVEDSLSMPRHVECHDCHNPHAAFEGTASAPYIAASLTGVSGVNASGAPTETARYQYEVCFRCHADGPDLPAPYVERQLLQPNVRLKVDPRNPSYHPIEEAGRNPDVPSLIFPLDEASIIYCTDCHAGDSTAPGAGPRGPHGSTWPFLLEQEYSVADGTDESYQSYAMCYKCHDRNVILGDLSFSEHSEHISDCGPNTPTPCSACHDPHGISATQGNFSNNTHLINFDTSIVQPLGPQGELRFEDLGSNAGECYLNCHNHDHNGSQYPQPPSLCLP
jgi:predicted CXXCH cytochrome family protein